MKTIQELINDVALSQASLTMTICGHGTTVRDLIDARDDAKAAVVSYVEDLEFSLKQYEADKYNAQQG